MKNKMKQGTHFILPVEFDLDLDTVEQIEFVFKQEKRLNSDIVKVNTYPYDCTRQENTNVILIPWTRDETFRFVSGRLLYMDTRITLRNSDNQPETEILPIKMNPTLFREGDI